MNYIILLVALLTGLFASLGLGGGMILIIYLTVFNGTEQLEAQGINLLFFIPIATLSLIVHTKNKLIDWKACIPSIACGVVFAVIGTFLAKSFGSSILTKMFAVFIFIIGLKELFSKDKTDEKS
ncbi:MAG TPA: sulfite exporter TauE/SafE family protein [Clostridiales bacterium]|nr:sulfite exporter TauE/SafE family protein [Clostridiales bacterium]